MVYKILLAKVKNLIIKKYYNFTLMVSMIKLYVK